MHPRRCLSEGDAGPAQPRQDRSSPKLRALHSSKQPAENFDRSSQPGTDWFRQQVQSDPDFFLQNSSRTSARKPVTTSVRNASRAAATNAMAGTHLGQLLLADVQDPAEGGGVPSEIRSTPPRR